MSRRKIKQKKPSKRKQARYQERLQQMLLERRQQLIKKGTATPHEPISPTATPQLEELPCAEADDHRLEKEHLMSAMQPEKKEFEPPPETL